MKKDDPLKILRDHTKSAPINLEALARALGLEFKMDSDLPDGISGHLMRNKDGDYEIASNGSEHSYRQRFSLAHEIGHFVLHKELVDIRGGVDDDTMYRSTDRGDIYNSYIDLVHERQANSFAANLLMPESLVRAAIDDLRSTTGEAKLTSLYRKFQVSPSAMRWRLKNLGLLGMVDDDA